MFKKILATAALAAFAALSTAQSKTLIINRVLINAPGGSDDGQGLELFEIKNTGSSSVSLDGVALVIIDNEEGERAELDGYYKFSGTLAAGRTLAIRDKTSGGAAGPALASAGTSNGSTVNYEFFSTPESKSASGTDLSNSGGNYILVDGFQESRFSSMTFGSTKLDSNDDQVLDFLATASTSDDLWTTPLDAVCVYPDAAEYGSNAQDDYISGLGLSEDHAIVAVATNSDNWTPDYLFRMYRSTGSGNVYDRFIQADVQVSGGVYTLDSAQMTWDDGTALATSDFRNASGVAATTFPTLYALAARGGNFTNWSSFDYILKNGFAYRH